MMSFKVLDIRPDRALLDPNFDGYKLCLAKIPMLNQELTELVYTALPSTDQFSYLNTKLFSTHNHLTGDHYDNSGSVYFVNKSLEVQKAYIDSLTNEIHTIKVWDIPNSCNRKDGNYNFSLSFVSESLVLLSDGAGFLYLLDSGVRMNNNTWNCIFSDEVIGQSKSFIIQDAIWLNNYIHCLLFHVEQENLTKNNVCILNWITLSKAPDNTWGCIALRELTCKGDIFYAYLEPSGNAIYCVSESSCKFTIDSENPIQIIPNNNPSKSFRWMQTSEFVKLKFMLPENYMQDNVNVEFKEDEISISYQNENYLKGSLVHEIDVNSSTWNVTTDVLQVCLKKKTSDTTWPEVVIGDNNGKYITTHNFVSSDNIGITECGSDVAEENTRQSEFGSELGHTFNSQQIEECDVEDADKLISFERLCVKTHEVTHRANFGVDAVLLTTKRIQDLAPAMIVRNDVDGCLWQPSGTDADFMLKHEATLFAFGYIQASKQQKKFIVCAPDLSYSVICESRRHVFIYQQNKPINNAELRNRTSGKRFGTVAQQHVISIPDDEILGIYATNLILILLTEKSIIALRL